MTKRMIMFQQKKLNNALIFTTRQFSRHSSSVLAANDVNRHNISTGNITFDKILGGGLPRGRISEIYGDTATGKTTLALKIISCLEKHHGTCAYIDTEYTLNSKYAKAMHVNINKVLLSRPSTEEQCLKICYDLIKNNAVDLIVVDSVAALVPTTEIHNQLIYSHSTLQSRVLSRWLKKIVPLLYQSKVTLLLLNQTRSKIGVVFGSPSMTPCNNVLKYYASIRIQIKLKKYVYSTTHNILGQKITAFVKENKLYLPFYSCPLYIKY